MIGTLYATGLVLLLLALVLMALDRAVFDSTPTWYVDVVLCLSVGAALLLLATFNFVPY